MNVRRMDDRGEINFLKILLFGGLAAAIYFGIAYVPLYLDQIEMKRVVRQACNVAYSAHGNMEIVRSSLVTGFKEAKMVDQIVDSYGTIMPRPTALDDQRVDIKLNDMGNLVTISISYDRNFVYPFTKKQRTKTFSITHSEDLAPIKY